MDDQLARLDLVVSKSLGCGKVEHHPARALERAEDTIVLSRAGYVLIARVSAFYLRKTRGRYQKIAFQAYRYGAEGTIVYPPLDLLNREPPEY